MSNILTKQDFDKIIFAYYCEHYGAKNTDEWLEAPAANVRIFVRDGKYITLKSHILTGEIEKFVE